MTTLEHIKDVGWHIFLPIVCMTYGALAPLSRYARTGLLDIIRADFIQTARAKGLSEGVVIIKHAARNGMIPIITLWQPYCLYSLVVRSSSKSSLVFRDGSMSFEAIMLRDYNVIMAILLISSLSNPDWDADQ